MTGGLVNVSPTRLVQGGVMDTNVKAEVTCY